LSDFRLAFGGTSSMHVGMLLLTDRVVDRLPPGSIVRDSKQSGLLVRIGKRTRVFRFEIAHRVGDSRRTISEALGSRPGTTTDEARTAAARLDAERRAGRMPAARRTGVTLGQAANEYLATLRGRWRIEAERFYKKHLTHWTNRSLASLSDSPEEVALWHRDVTQRCGPFAANHSARVLRAAYRRRQRFDRTLPAMSPTSGVEFNPQHRADRAVPFDQFPTWWAQIDAIENPVRGAFHRLCPLTGCRPSELARLKTADVDFEKHQLIIGHTKPGIDLTIPTSPEIEKELRAAVTGSQWMFPSARGASGHLSSWREDGLTWCGNAGRHSYRTVAASLGCDELSIRLLQGHALSGISQGYITRSLLVGTSLHHWQLRISKRVAELAAK
jgi:integrase